MIVDVRVIDPSRKVGVVSVNVPFEPGAYPPGPDGSYILSKRTPWDRMTDDEADQVYAAMQVTSPRLRGIYDAATHLSSNDELWPVMHEILASVVGEERADELLARET